MRLALAGLCVAGLASVGGEAVGQRLDDLRPRSGGEGIVELSQDRGQEAGKAEADSGELLSERLVAIDVASDGDVPRSKALKRLLDARLGVALDEAGLSELLDIVLGHYESCGRPVVEVWVEEQDFSTGRVVIGIADGRIGEVRIEEGRHFSRPLLERRIFLEPGDVVTQGTLDRQMRNLDGSRFREIEMFAAPGDELGQTDLLYRVTDRRPWRLTAGYENSGTAIAGEDRWFAGFELGNLWGLDHRLSGQVTTGRRVDRYSGGAVIYEVPLDWGHRIIFEGAIADVDVPVDVLGLAVDVETQAWEAGMRYEVPLTEIYGVEHAVSVGSEFSSAAYDFSSGGVQLRETGTESFHVVGRYDARRTDDFGIWSWGGKLAFSPGGVSGLDSDSAYGAVRQEASSDGTYGTARLERLQRLPWGFVFLGKIGAQWSSTRLLPEEMLTLGGAQRVRGYREREVFGDEGFWGTAEVRTPGIAVLEGRAGGVDEDVVQLLGFFDWGDAGVLGGPERRLRSAGAGLRYRLGENVDLRFDYGWQLDGTGSRGHIGLLVSW